jgi:hypothetical protein
MKYCEAISCVVLYALIHGINEAGRICAEGFFVGWASSVGFFSGLKNQRYAFRSMKSGLLVESGVFVGGNVIPRSRILHITPQSWIEYLRVFGMRARDMLQVLHTLHTIILTT